jgi:hypothetical protein
MPKIKYESIRIQKSGLDLIEQVNEITEDYYSRGYSLTLRQVYYQLVSRGMIENTERSYKNTGELISRGRMAGLIDWYMIEDRTRNLRGRGHWENPKEILNNAANGYHIDFWENQKRYVEVWVEKDALIGIVEQAVWEYDVPCFSCRGYTSQSEMWSAAMRLIDKWKVHKKECIIIHLGDHDPSGIDMTRDIQDRLRNFGAVVAVDRVALNMNQIEEFNPPPNPAKITDSRAVGYIKEFGETSWELDALDPSEIERLISENIEFHLNKKQFEKAKKAEKDERNKLLNFIKGYGGQLNE